MIFISYSSKDAHVAERLYDFLIDSGYSCRDIFIDRDARSGIKLGADWEKEILRNAESCRALLMLCSPSWLESRWCFAELAIAKRANTGIHLIPVVIAKLSDAAWRQSGVDSSQKFVWIDAPDRSLSDSEPVPADLLERLDELGLGPSHELQPRVDQHPDRLLFQFSTWETWSSSPEMNTSLELGAEQEGFITQLSTSLRDAVKGNYRGEEIRITGEPGTGKTRLVMEAIRRDTDLQRILLYYDDPSRFLEEPYITELSRPGNDFRHVIVVDDCHNQYRSSVRNQVLRLTGRIVLVLITHDLANDPFKVPLLSGPQIAAILKSYRGDLGEMLAEYADMCKGSPRFAHLVGASLKADEKTTISHPDAGRIVERIVCGKAGENSPEAQTRLTVARFAAMFDRFGVEHPYEKEVNDLANWVAQYHPAIGLGDVLKAIDALRQARVLQGRRTVYLVPLALRWRLWGEWWRIYGANVKIADLVGRDPELWGFFVQALGDSPERSVMEKLVVRLLRTDPWFYNTKNFDDRRGSQLFRLLGDYAPREAVLCIERNLGYMSESQLAENIRNRKTSIFTIVEVLRYASLWEKTAIPAMRLLLKMVIQEANDRGDLRQAFCGFFTLGTGRATASEVHPEKRFAFLDELLNSNNEQQRRLALAACRTAVNGNRTFRLVQWSKRGSRAEPTFWRPDRSQYAAVLQSIWDRLCVYTARDCPEAELVQVWNVIADAFFRLVQREDLADHCLESIRTAADRSRIELMAPLLDGILGLLRHRSELSDQRKRELTTLYEEIVNRTFETRLKRFVGMEFFEDEPVIDLDYPRLHDFNQELRSLAEKSISNPAVLVPFLGWLNGAASRIIRFGRELGTLDADCLFLDQILENLRINPSVKSGAFLSGYLVGASANHSDLIQSTIGRLVKEEELQSFLPEVVRRTGTLLDYVSTVTELIKPGSMTPSCLSVFRYAGELKELQNDDFLECVQLLRSSGNLGDLQLAFEFLDFRYGEQSGHRGDVPVNMIAEMLSEPELLKVVRGFGGQESNLEHFWSQLLSLLLASDCSRAVGVVRQFFESFVAEPRIWGSRTDGEALQAVIDVIDDQPEQAWREFFVVLGSGNSEVVQELLHWLGGDEYSIDGSDFGMWPSIPEAMLWQWIDVNRTERAKVVASQLPPLVTEEGLTQVTSSFLQRYSDIREVQDHLTSPQVPGFIVGNQREFDSRRLETAIRVRNDTEDPQLKTWLNRYIEELTATLERDTSNDDRDNEERSAQ